MSLLKKFIIVIFILSGVQFSFCQEAESAEYKSYNYNVDTTMKIRSATEEEFTVDVRLLSEDIIEKYKNDPEFNYDGGPEETDDWITKIKNWINQQLATIWSSKAYSTVLDYLYYALMIVALILIIRGLIKGDRRGLIFGEIKTDEIKMMESEEDITQLNFDELIISAIGRKDFKLAVRYLFLKSLKLLSEKGIVELRNNKTNHQYLLEIKNNRISGAFQIATSRFEWVWYGDSPIDEKILKSSQNDFNELFELIAK